MNVLVVDASVWVAAADRNDRFWASSRGFLLRSLASEVHDIDAPMLKAAVAVGTECFLRAGDALYEALADRLSGRLVSWDNELLRLSTPVWNCTKATAKIAHSEVTGLSSSSAPSGSFVYVLKSVRSALRS